MRVKPFQLRGLTFSFIAVLCLLTAANAQSPAFVQVAAKASSGTAKTFSLAFPKNTVAGDLILVAFDYDTNSTPSSVTDSQSNGFTAIGNQLTTPGGARSRVYYAKNIKGGADTVTVTLSANSGWIEMYLTEYSGADQTNPIDSQAGATGGAGAASSGNAATTVAGDVIFGYCVGDWTCTLGSGFTLRSNFNNNLNEDKVSGNAGNYAATGTATNGWSMQMVALKPVTVTGQAPVITSSGAASGTVGIAFTYQITATNSPTSYGATGLPGGLSVNTGTGLISGTPTTAGTSTVTLSATNSNGTGTAPLTLTVNPAPPVITSPGTASGTKGSAFSYQITATNSPTSFGATGLPGGLSVNTGTGLISGTPTTAGTSTVTLSATNAGGTGTAPLTLTINPAAPAITSSATATGTVGTAFSYQITATNSPTSFGATGLPAGLSVNTATGLISGTPTTAGTSTVTLSATNAGGTGTAPLTLTINPAAPAITSSGTASGTVGIAFSYQITATNSPTSYGATGLAAGLSINTSTGLISGTPTTAGTSTVTLSATNAGGMGTAPLTLTINPAVPVITSSGTAGGTVGIAFSYQITATNSPTSYGATGLAAGLSINTSTGLISGTPTTPATSTVTLSATNAAGTGTAPLTLTISNPGAPVISSSGTANGTVGTAFSYQITATNSPTSYGATGLPVGLSVNTGTGLISGTPTTAGTSTVTLSATNAGGTGTAPLTLTINPAAPAITSSGTASGTVGTAFSYQIAATNSPTSYGASGLPGGLSVNTATGLISGTPTTAGTSTVTLSATNAGGTGTAPLTLTINPAAPAITSSGTATGTVGTAFSYQITATNSPTSFGATGLPAGLSVSTTTGLISGTPTTAGTSTVTLSATNAGGTGTAPLTLTINPAAPAITSSGTANGTVGTAFSYQITATNSPTSFGATGLPAGLSVNTGTGLISGTPTAAGTSTVTLSATNAGGTGTAPLTLTVNPVAPVITSSGTATGTKGIAFSYQITATNSPTSYGATGLPAGLSVNTGTGLISGTPTTAGISTVTLSATNAGGTGTAPLTLTINSVSSFVQAAAGATPGAAQSFTLSFSQNTAPGNLILVAFDYDTNSTASTVTDSQGNGFTAIGNQLTTPGGARSRVYYAKNIKGGADTVTVTLSANSGWIELYLTEYSGADLTNPIDVQAGATGNAGSVSSGNATTTMAGDIIFGYCLADWTCTGGAGFTARSNFHNNLIEDKLAGNPGSYSATGTANNSWAMQMVAIKPATINNPAPPVITSPGAASGAVGSAFSYQITATNSPTSYAATGLPAGLSINSGTGLVSGTPTAAGTSTVTLSATNAGGTGTAPLTLTINNQVAPVITSPGTASGTVGSPFVYQITASNSPSSYGAAGLPAGLSVNSGTGLISGTPTTAGTTPVTLSATNAGGTGTAPLTLTIVAAGSLTISPRTAALTFTRSQQFTANTTGILWMVDGMVGGSGISGTISTSGLYAPPTNIGVHTVTVTTSDHSQSANATVYVTNYAGKYTHQNDNARTGQNLSETVLTPSNVNSTQFGKLFTYPLDGQAFASPLYVANVNIPGQGLHNVVYMATEHDSVYAFDADGLSSTPLWQTSFINPAAGVTTVSMIANPNICCDIYPEVGITSTPAIDPTTGTIYVVARTAEVSGSTTNYVTRLHALDITTGAEKFGGPAVIQASVPGLGGAVPYADLTQNQRAGLLLNNGVVYIASGSYSDQYPYHGWIMGYDATTLQQTMVFCSTPNSPLGGGIWQSGGGPAADADGNIYFITGNGNFNGDSGGTEWGDTFIKISPSGTVLDYFTPHDQANMVAHNLDLGSAGVLLLPDQPGVPPRLMGSAGKSQTIYLVNRDSMGHYNPNNDSQIVQELVNIFPNGMPEPGNFSSPVYFNGNVYFSPINDTAQVFQLINGLLSTSPTSHSSAIYSYPGGVMAVSANGSSNGLLWDVQYIKSTPGILHVYDATNLGNELYNSNQAGTRDTMDQAVKFNTPAVANGKVYVGGNTSLTVYGLLP